ncbi:hypothetical protein CRE_17609 [Caenorhabditis remanei]|uniref:Uncharacterized protein n=1 Tax=Caenorhabditis remanei TaxID=31234 RepID=E3NHA6_CAERE|nr:hypothetical protein CRE_17609 [Caenorhabditis remanei]
MVFDGDPKGTYVFPQSAENLCPELVIEYEKLKQYMLAKRLKNEQVYKEASDNCKKYTRCSASTIARILKPMRDYVEQITAEEQEDKWKLVTLKYKRAQSETQIEELLAEKGKDIDTKSVGVTKGVQTEEQYLEKVHISNNNVEKVTVSTETEGSNDSESENKLIDYKKERKSLCEGQGIANIVFEKKLGYGVDKVSISGNAKDMLVMKSNKVLCCEEIKADEIQNSCTEITHEKDENIGVTKRCTIGNISDDKLCSGDQTPGKAQRSVTFTQCETNEQSVQQKIVSDVIDSNVDLVKDQEERKVQNTVLERKSMQLLKNMLVVENPKQDYKANSVGSTDGVSWEDEAKRKKVDQKAEDTVTCPGPPLNSKSSNLISYHTKHQNFLGNNTESVVEKNCSSDFSIPNPGKPGLKKKGDGTGGVVFRMKTKCRKREEPRPRTDPPNLSMTYVKNEIIAEKFSVIVACEENVTRSHQSTSNQSAWSETKSKRLEVEPRPRKDPPQSILLNWSDTKTGRIKEEPRPRKDPPHSWIMFDDTWRRTKEEHRPRKDPPMSHTQHNGHHGNLFGCRNQRNRLQDTARNLISC